MAQLRKAGAFSRVVAPADIAALMAPEQQKFLMRCASDECAVVDNELAGALGVTHILVGNLGRLGNTYLLNLRLLDARSSVLVASLSNRTRSETEDALLDMVQPALQDLLQQSGLGPPAPTPADGKSARRGPWLVGGGVLAASGVALVLGAALAAACGAVGIYDLASGWRPGEPHALTATQGRLADGLLAAAALTLGAGVLGVLGASIAFAVGGLVS